MVMWLLRESRVSFLSVHFLAIISQGVLGSHYGVMLEEYSCH